MSKPGQIGGSVLSPEMQKIADKLKELLAGGKKLDIGQKIYLKKINSNKNIKKINYINTKIENIRVIKGTNFEYFSEEGKKTFSRYFKLDVKNEAGAIAKVSSLFAHENISIEALVQKESKQNSDIPSVPVVIISGPISDTNAFQMSGNLDSMEEIINSVKQFRIHNAL